MVRALARLRSRGYGLNGLSIYSRWRLQTMEAQNLSRRAEAGTRGEPIKVGSVRGAHGTSRAVHGPRVRSLLRCALTASRPQRGPHGCAQAYPR